MVQDDVEISDGGWILQVRHVHEKQDLIKDGDPREHLRARMHDECAMQVLRRLAVQVVHHVQREVLEHDEAGPCGPPVSQAPV